MINISSSNLAKIIEAYKVYFKEYFSIELYKWKAVRCFLAYWDIEAVNFKGMLKQALSKTENLLTSMNNYPRNMLEEFCELDETKVREMFRELFDENQNVVFRINQFRKNADELLRLWGKGKQHYQTLNAITTYLWLRYPDKYYIYKYSCARKMVRELMPSMVLKKGSGAEEVSEVFKLYDEIAKVLQKDADIRKMLDNVLTEDCYPDKNLRTAVVDLAYFVGRYYHPEPKMLPEPGTKVQTWIYSPGEGARKWDETVRQRIDRAININEVCDVNPFGVEATIAAYNEGEDWLLELLDYLKANYDCLCAFFRSHLPEIPVIKLEGTYLVWTDCRALHLPSDTLQTRLLETTGLWLNSGTMYGAEGEGFLRWNIACPRSVLQDALSRFKGFADALTTEG